MSYGIELINSVGTVALDSDHQTLRVVASGTTKSFNTQRNARVDDYNAIGGNKAFIDLVHFGGSHIAHSALALTNKGPLENAPTFTAYAIEPVFPGVSGGGWSAFYRFTGTPIFLSQETEFDLPGYPEGVFCTVSGSRQYKLTAPVATPGGYDTDYGLQVRNAANEVIFDSRDEYLAVRYAFIVPIAVMWDVLLNNAVKNITLPESMPNCWVSIPVLAAINVKFIETWTEGGSTWRSYRVDYVQVQQTSNTNIQVSRRTGDVQTENWPTGDTPLPRIFYEYAHDLIVYVARNP